MTLCYVCGLLAGPCPIIVYVLTTTSTCDVYALTPTALQRIGNDTHARDQAYPLGLFLATACPPCVGQRGGDDTLKLHMVFFELEELPEMASRTSKSCEIQLKIQQTPEHDA